MNLDIFTTIFLHSYIFTIHQLCTINKQIYNYSLTPYLWQLKNIKNNNKTLMQWCVLYHENMAKNHLLSKLKHLTDYKSFKKMAYVMIHTALIENKQTDIYVKIEITHDQLIYKLLPFVIPKNMLM
jgi:hypothetical protein